MKVTEIIAFRLKDLLGTGALPRYLVLSPKALELLVREVHAEKGEEAAAALLNAESTVTYQDMEVIVADLPILSPIHVCAAVRDMMELYNIKVRKA